MIGKFTKHYKLFRHHNYENVTANYNKYRKSYTCPVKGCRSKKKIKKLSNHLTQVHRIKSSAERLKLLQTARELQPMQPAPMPAGQLSITSAFKTSTSPHITTSSLLPKKGSTRNFLQYSAAKTPQLVNLNEHLVSFDRGFKSKEYATQVCVDMGKYVTFASPEAFRWSTLVDHLKVKSYIKKLDEIEIGPDGIVSKLDNLVLAIKYASKEVAEIANKPHDVQKITERIAEWRSSYKVKKRVTRY